MFQVLYTSDHSAIGNEDYVAKHNESVYIEGYQSKQLYIGILDDVNVEDEEQFFVKIAGAAVGGGIRVVNISIADNDRKLPDNTLCFIKSPLSIIGKVVRGVIINTFVAQK